jgi:hypothetical protein
VNLVFDIFQGIGVAAAVGIRPFLPALAVGALAAGDVQIDFIHSHFAFIQRAPFLIGMAVGFIVWLLAEWLLSDKAAGRPLLVVRVAFGLALGGLLFGAALCRGGHRWWPGLIAGVLCAAIGTAATGPLLARVKSRLDEGAAKLLPFLAELAALLIAVLSVVAPPVGPIVLAALIWLLIANRGRDEQKYAGLRILR